MASEEESSKSRQETDSRMLGAAGEVQRRRRKEAREEEVPRGWARSALEGRRAVRMWFAWVGGAWACSLRRRVMRGVARVSRSSSL